jgi:hypothetical protein
MWPYLITAKLMWPSNMKRFPTPGLCSFLNRRDQDSHPYKTTSKIMALYIFNLYIPREQAGRQKTLNRMVAGTPRI